MQISIQTHCANDFSKESKRQTIYTQDVISALKELSFGDLEKPLEEFLESTSLHDVYIVIRLYIYMYVSNCM
jgi:hypothetical protein